MAAPAIRPTYPRKGDQICITISGEVIAAEVGEDFTMLYGVEPDRRSIIFGEDELKHFDSFEIISRAIQVGDPVLVPSGARYTVLAIKDDWAWVEQVGAVAMATVPLRSLH